MSLGARKETTSSLAARYAQAGRKEKSRILNEFVKLTGFHRKYAITVLRKGYSGTPRKSTVSARVYDEEVRETLTKIWEYSNRLCSKRLKPYLEEFIGILERRGYLKPTATLREKLCRISPATMDRLLIPARRQRGISATRPMSLLKQQIPIRTFGDWEQARPGFVEADTVVHCGTNLSGSFLSTLVITDVLTGWTECLALDRGDPAGVLSALGEFRELFPVPLLAFDSDNGTEFLNSSLLSYCREESILFTRSRPYKKNDQCRVEQKNGAIVRRVVGYDRYEGKQAQQGLAELYGTLRLHINFFQPSMRLVEKKRDGARVHKTYDFAKTPCQRMLDSPEVAETDKKRLRAEYEQLDPVVILERLNHLRNRLWTLAWDVRRPQPPIESVTVSQPVKIRKPRQWKKAIKSRYPLGEHQWNSRKNPFESVWDEVQEEWWSCPEQTAKSLFQRLQKKYPGVFKDGQVRTLQRRFKEWRTKYTEGRNGVEKPSLQLSLPMGNPEGEEKSPSRLGNEALREYRGVKKKSSK